VWTPKHALVVGSAPCVSLDLMNAPDWPMIVVNWAGIRHLGPIEFWASIHRKLIYKGIKARREAGGDMDFTAYVKLPKNQRLQDVPPPTRIAAAEQTLGSGSSALFAVEIALRLGYKRLILCGVPLEGTTTLQENGEEERLRKGQPFVETFRPAWIRNFELLSPRVRSMSGWTREFLGGPDEPFA
jgi:hypothetical protein